LPAIVGIPATSYFAQTPTNTVIGIVIGRVKHRLNSVTLIYRHSVWPPQNATSGWLPTSIKVHKQSQNQAEKYVYVCAGVCTVEATAHSSAQKQPDTDTATDWHRRTVTTEIHMRHATPSHKHTRVKKGRLRPAECGNNRHSGEPAEGQRRAETPACTTN